MNKNKTMLERSPACVDGAVRLFLFDELDLVVALPTVWARESPGVQYLMVHTTTTQTWVTRFTKEV